MIILLAAVVTLTAPLPALSGNWQGTGAAAQINVSYSPISNNLATVERWRTTSGRETMTVYVDSATGLRATHYCGQGNVASLRATTVSPGRVIFDFVEAEGVDQGEGVLVRLVLESDATHLRRMETYRKDGSDSTEIIDFVRAP